MNLKDLKYLVALGEHQHFGKAATACFVSQPALSMQIKKLEETLGVQLLERTNKSVMLTESGINIIQYAKQVLSQVDEIHEIAKSSKDPYAGELKIGIFPTLAPYLLPHIMPGLSKKFPKLSFYLIEQQSKVLLEQLKNGELHAIFLALPIADTNLQVQPLFSEEFFLCASNQHALANKKNIQEKDLNEQDILLLEEGHCLRDQALSYCHRIQAKETQSFRATSLETLRHMVSAQVGVTLVPKLACTENASLVYIPFKESKPTRSIGLVWRTSTAKQLLLGEVGDCIKDLLRKGKQVEVI